MFKHGNMGQGIYVDPARDFCGVYFGLATLECGCSEPNRVFQGCCLRGRNASVS